MEFRNIMTFIKVSELMSFTKAAKVLGYTQSNISAQIQQLENELGCPLFERMGKTISLSVYGKKFLPYAIEIERKVEHAKVAIGDEHTDYSEIHIGILESLCITYMPELVIAFHKKYPNINIIIKIGTYDELSQMLNTNQIDLLWTFDNPIEIPAWTKAFERAIPIYVISSSSHTILKEKSSQLASLKEAQFIFTEKNCSYRLFFENMLHTNHIDYNVFMEIGNTEIIKKFVISGLCLSVLPQFAIQNEIAEGKIGIVPLSDFSFQMYSQIFYHKEKYLTASILYLLDLLKLQLDND